MVGVKGRSGRLHRQGTVLAREMTLRNLKISVVAVAMGASHSTVNRCLRRERTVAPMELAALCKLLRCQPSQIVDSDGKLKEG